MEQWDNFQNWPISVDKIALLTFAIYRHFVRGGERVLVGGG